MKNKWIDPRKKLPKHLQNVLFVVNNTQEVLIGFYMKPEAETSKGYLGKFITGTVYDKKSVTPSLIAGCAWGIGFNVWKQNNGEVAYWTPIIFNKPPKTKQS